MVDHHSKGAMEEEWRDVIGYEGYYEVSNLGRIRSKDRVIQYSDGRVVHRRSLLKSPTLSGNSYPRVGLQVNGKLTMKMVHRIVAEAFISNPNNYPIVNHKDEDKTNCQVSNLEWCDNSYNVSYSNKGIDRRSTKLAYNTRIVLKLSLDGIELGRYNGAKEACEKNGYKRGRLDTVLYNKHSRIYDGYIWIII